MTALVIGSGDSSRRPAGTSSDELALSVSRLSAARKASPAPYAPASTPPTSRVFVTRSTDVAICHAIGTMLIQ